jgi:hypothetical protein
MTTYYEDYEDSRGEQQALDQEAHQQMAEAEAEDIMAKAVDVYEAEDLVVRSEFLYESLTSLTVWLAYLRINRHNGGAVADAVDGLLALFEEEALRVATSRVDGREIERGNPYE